MRDPSINIKKSDLLKVLKRDFNMDTDEAEDTANKLLKSSKRFACNERMSLQKVKKAVRRKIERTSQIARDEIMKFNACLYQVRSLELHHRGVKDIKEGDSQYPSLVDIAASAKEFANTYNFDLEEGYRNFILKGIALMRKRYGLNKFKSYRDKIFSHYEAEYLVKNDEDHDGSLKFFDIYDEKLRKRATVIIDRLSDPEKFLDFVLAREEADKCDADYTNWIDAQFAGLEFANALPEPYQLHGDGALGRYQKYLIDVNPVNTKNMKFSSEEEREAYIKAN